MTPEASSAATRHGVGALLRSSQQRLRDAGVPSPEYDARALLAHVLGTSAGALAVVDGIDDRQQAAYERLIDERADRVPLQHLTGLAGFRRLDLVVGPGVFVPRPETEVLVDWVLDQLDGVAAPVIVDLCSGSGALAFAIADELPAARVYAVEVDPLAVAWSRRNLDRLGDERPGFAGRVSVHEGDIADALPELDGRVDAVVANPPYIPLGATVEPEVAQHDPALALWGGEDGLDTVRSVLTVAARLLRPGGVLAVEHADLQGRSVPALFRSPSRTPMPAQFRESRGNDRSGMGRWAAVADRLDLSGRPRFTTATRMGEPETGSPEGEPPR